MKFLVLAFLAFMALMATQALADDLLGEAETETEDMVILSKVLYGDPPLARFLLVWISNYVVQVFLNI